MSNFLILGGAGFIGGNFADYVLCKGHKVVIVDNFNTSAAIDMLKYVDNDDVQVYTNHGDGVFNLNNYEISTLDNLISNCDYIIHLAASVGVKYVDDNPHHTIVNNLEMERIVFSINELYQKPIFFASTSEVYGEGFNSSSSQMDDFRETDTLTIGAPTQTRWGYACSKLMGEFLLYSYTQPFVIGRFFNITSRNQLSKYGMVLPSFVENALNDEPLMIYGTGNAVRCYCHIDDAIDAMYKTITNKKCHRQIFNIGNPTETSVYELACKVRELTLNPVQVIFDEETRCDTDIKRRVPNIDKLKKYIEWVPEKNLDTIILDMIAEKNK